MRISRRKFIRVVGGVGLSSTVPLSYVFGAEKTASAESGILVEAASFTELGGWKIDTQHYQQMGGCYLLAHGMGKPVASAATSVTIPRAGKWNVWVRTRDWCPGDWQAPGRFKVLVDGKLLKPEFGTESKTWHWQKGGALEISSPGKIKVELKDLTGFDGRCDAIYFSQEASPVLANDNLVELAAWKDRLSGRAAMEIKEQKFDVVIVGGGISGCGAALAASKQGLKVALIQDRPLFGGNASQEIRVHTIGIYGKGKAILKTIDTEHYPNGHERAIKDQNKREATMVASEVNLFAHHMAVGLEKVGDRIASVEAREVTTGIIRRFRAPVFIDATGDGWLGYWCGADYRYGREASSEFGEGWKEHGDLWSPEIADNRVMGTSVLWNSKKTAEKSSFPDVPWAMPVAKKHIAIKGEWYWEYSDNDLDQIDDAEQIRDHMLRAIYGSFANAKKSLNNAKVALNWVAYVGGKRESRRLMGDYLYTMKDMTERRQFDDAVVEEVREIDTHYQKTAIGSPLTFLSWCLFHKTGGTYYIPFRSLYSKNISNLMMAGRNFSCSHIGLAGPRVMKTCGQMGIATGYAASLCIQHRTNPRGVYQNHIDELRELIGVRTGVKIGIGGESRRANEDDKKYDIHEMPEELRGLSTATIPRGNMNEPAPSFKFKVSEDSVVYIAVHDLGGYRPP
ncbi:MAG: FAD-dependent oxidoreductase, partial [bacterium]|nr:FAD-dependent oxidoreductase [bacterium]